MESLKLNKKQIDKILEMSRFLFPEYDWITINIDYFIVLTKNGKSKKRKDGSTYIDGEATIIHWYEFCITHLSNALYHDIDYHDCSGWNINLHEDLILDIYNNKINPIDSLYNEFKKINE